MVLNRSPKQGWLRRVLRTTSNRDQCHPGVGRPTRATPSSSGGGQRLNEREASPLVRGRSQGQSMIAPSVNKCHKAVGTSHYSPTDTNKT